MFPVINTEYATTDGVKRLTDHYRNKHIVPGLVKAYSVVFQELEVVFFDIIQKFLLKNDPTGDQLDIIGRLVGAERGSLNDADYLAKVRLQIRVNRAQGLSEDVIQVATLATHEVPRYLDMPPSEFIVELDNLSSPLVVSSLLHHVRATGSRGVMHYTTWAPGNDFEMSSIYDSTAGEGTFGSEYTSSVGGLFSAGTEF